MNFKRLKKWVAVALGTVMMTAALAGCGGEQKQEAKGDDNTLVVYCPHPIAFINPLVEEFEKSSGVKVEVIAAGSGELLKRVESEKANPLGDIFWGGHRLLDQLAPTASTT